jgi:hypothetical protein
MSSRVAVATKHGKLDQIAPSFSDQKKWKLELAQRDTNIFGTFTGEVERKFYPRETVIAKAQSNLTFS